MLCYVGSIPSGEIFASLRTAMYTQPQLDIKHLATCAAFGPRRRLFQFGFSFFLHATFLQGGTREGQREKQRERECGLYTGTSSSGVWTEIPAPVKDDAAEGERTNGSEAFCARSQHVVLRAGVFADERRHLFARSLARSLAPTSEHRGIARRKKAFTQSATSQKPKERRATTKKNGIHRDVVFGSKQSHNLPQGWRVGALLSRPGIGAQVESLLPARGALRNRMPSNGNKEREKERGR